MDRVLTAEQVADIGRCQKMLPREADFIGKRGYEKKYNQDGTYRWRYKYTQNDGGKWTKEGREVLERMRPFMRADCDRSARLQAMKPRVQMRDGDGKVRPIAAGLADEAARRNGWSHVWRARGNRVEFGFGGMLWRWAGGAWEPLGVRCLGIPLRGGRRVPRSGVQCDPDGNPWRWIAGAWRRVT